MVLLTYSPQPDRSASPCFAGNAACVRTKINCFILSLIIHLPLHFWFLSKSYHPTYAQAAFPALVCEALEQSGKKPRQRPIPDGCVL